GPARLAQGIGGAAAGVDDGAGQAEERGAVRVIGAAEARQADGVLVEPGHLAERAVRRDAGIAGVRFGDREGNGFAGPGVEAALAGSTAAILLIGSPPIGGNMAFVALVREWLFHASHICVDCKNAGRWRS